MLHRIQFPGKYIQDAGALSELPALIAQFGQRGFVLASPSAHRILGRDDTPEAVRALPSLRFGGECSEAEIARSAAALAEARADVLVGMGGGKAIDTAKIVADRAGIPVVVVPTIASTDAPCSGCAVVYSEAGVFEAVHYQRANPAVVLVDTRIIAEAPARFLVAGMGDALSTWFEARSCAAAQSRNECGGLGTMTGFSLAKLCFETLLRYGPSARHAAERHVVTPALEHIVEANTLLSGIGFESGGLASAHSIHNGLTALEETHAFYHGEKVAFGTLAGLALTDADPAEAATVYTFCEEVGLPTTLAELGLGNCSRERLLLVAEKACAPAEYIHHEACAVSPRKVFDAMLAADAIGQARRHRAAAD